MDAYPPRLSDSDRSIVLLFLSARNVGWLGLTTLKGSLLDRASENDVRTPVETGTGA